MRAAIPTITAILVLAGILAACAPGPAACPGAARVARDIRTLDGLIADSTVAIAQGYRLAPRPAPAVNFCLGGAGAHLGVNFCTDGQGQVPVAIDVRAETRQLEDMKARRAALAQKQAQETMQCRSAV